MATTTKRVQDIAKILVKAGMTKMEWCSKDKCSKGDYEIKAFNYKGIHSYIDVNTGIFNEAHKGASIHEIMSILSNAGLKVENRNGSIAIFK